MHCPVAECISVAAFEPMVACARDAEMRDAVMENASLPEAVSRELLQRYADVLRVGRVMVNVRNGSPQKGIVRNGKDVFSTSFLRSYFIYCWFCFQWKIITIYFASLYGPSHMCLMQAHMQSGMVVWDISSKNFTLRNLFHMRDLTEISIAKMSF